MSYHISKEDILKRVYFIVNLVQSQSGDTMQGALTSKSDAMGGIFDRFINSLSEDVIFNNILLPELGIEKEIEIVKDYYLYRPTSNGAGIAPDVFGIKVDGKTIPFVQFDEKWKAVEGMPQIEVKTFKAKDQMISLRNQDYDDEYLVLSDLRLRIDYLVPFFDKELLSASICEEMKMDDDAFIKNDKTHKIDKIREIDFSSDDIGEIDIISITTGIDFMSQATLCGPKIGPRRIKEIRERKVKLDATTGRTLNEFCFVSSRIDSLFEYNNEWYQLTKVDAKTTKYVDFYGTNIENIEISRFNGSSVVVKALSDGCSINDFTLIKGKQYIIEYATLERDGNEGSEYFMQKQCARHLTSRKETLLNLFKSIIENS